MRVCKLVCGMFAPSVGDSKYCRIYSQYTYFLYILVYLLACFSADQQIVWIRDIGKCESHDCWLHPATLFYQVRAFGGSVEQEPFSCHLQKKNIYYIQIHPKPYLQSFSLVLCRHSLYKHIFPVFVDIKRTLIS